jgi:hypothetical protein
MPRRIPYFACIALFSLGCNAADEVTVALATEGLVMLDSTYKYEAWLFDGDDYQSLGKFDVLSDGSLEPSTFKATEEQMAVAKQVVISIEPADDPDPAPAVSKVLAGDLDAEGAELSMSHAKAVGTDFTAAQGKFMLATPTTGGDDLSEQGIWWIDPDAGADLVPGLVLPPLPPGWKYEGWVQDETGPESTGKFLRVDEADEDGAGHTAGTDGAPPPFPGRDFIDPPRILTIGHTALVSLEPVPDPANGKFGAKVLMKDITPDVYPATQTAMNIASEALPKATVTIMKP